MIRVGFSSEHLLKLGELNVYLVFTSCTCKIGWVENLLFALSLFDPYHKPMFND